MPLIETDLEENGRATPLDVVEAMAINNTWPFERDEDEITLLISGVRTQYTLVFTWMPDIEALHLACDFELKVPEPRIGEVQQLIRKINETLWIGHFDFWVATGDIIFRHALVLSGNSATIRQCEAIFGAALDNCERYYPAFQYVVWAGKKAEEAFSFVNFETKGNG